MIRDTNQLVSIGVPVYNGAHCLREVLDSLVAQTYKNLEIIISDNASDDGTDKTCEEYARRDGRIKYFRQKENIGGVANFNFVLEKSRGDYFMWAAADDRYEKTFVEKCSRKFEEDPEYIMVSSNLECFDETGTALKNYDLRPVLPIGKDLYKRLKSHILAYRSDSKGAPIYGLWDKRKIGGDRLRNYPGWHPSDTGFDVSFIFRNLSRGTFGLVDEALFFKNIGFRKEFRARKGLSGIFHRIFHSLVYRLRRIFSPTFLPNMIFVLGIKELSLWKRIKLFLLHFWVITRLFLRRKM